MEKLIFSSQFPSKLHLNLPQLARVTPHKPGFLPLPTTTESCRVNSIFPLKNDRFQLRVSCFSKPDETLLVKSSIPRGVSPEPNFDGNSSSYANTKLQKVIVVAKIALLSALAIFAINPVLPLPAFASFHTATKTTEGALTRGLLRTEVLTSAWTGFFAGCLHTLSGPDHLAALAPLSIGRSQMESAAVGALWGCGHDVGQLIFGLLFLILKDRLQIEILQIWGSRVVGLTLCFIGALGIKEAIEVPALDPGVALENVDGDASVYETPLAGKKKKKIGFATFATGVVHGLQPDALMIVLPALALPSRLAGGAFLGMFLVGTVVAMGGYTAFIGSCSEALKDKIPRITEKLTWASSLVAIGLGLTIIVSQFFGFSLY